MKKTERFKIMYEISGNKKVCYCNSKEQKQATIDYCKVKNIKIVSCEKLYPFNSLNNQHNFDLIATLCVNTINDMITGNKQFNEQEYNKLVETRKEAEDFLLLELPTAWLPYDKWKRAKELSLMAILHRDEKH